MHRRVVSLTIGFISVLLLCGCRPDGPAMGTIAGKVTLDGVPVFDHIVEFRSEEQQVVGLQVGHGRPLRDC